MGKKKDAKKAARRAAEIYAAGVAQAENTASGAKATATPGASPFVVPDELRRVGETLIAKANSPEGREMIASGLALAATAAAAATGSGAGRQRRQSPHAGEERPAPPVPPVPPTPAAPQPGVGGTQPIDPQAVADAIGDAAGALLTRLFGAKRS